jgi:DNA-binding NarL/FixJ family response regulator
MNKRPAMRSKRRVPEFIGTTSDGVRVVKPPRGRGNLTEAQIRKVVAGLVEGTKGQIEAAEARRLQLLRPLSEREREIVDLVIDGHSDADAASALGASSNDVATVRSQIMARFGARDRAELLDVLTGQQRHPAE